MYSNDPFINSIIDPEESEEMGCDIHVFHEHKNEDGTWSSSNKWTWEEDLHKDSNGNIIQDYSKWVSDAPHVWRNYDMFGLIANVRRDVEGYLEPKGMPDDVSMEVQRESDDWDVDGHSHSWLNKYELAELVTKHLIIPNAQELDYAIEGVNELLKTFPDIDSEQRIVFWFDN